MKIRETIYGRGAVKGVAQGEALISRKTIIGWGGIDIYTGEVIEKGHPLEGKSIKDKVLILDGSRGSNGWSLFFHSAQVSGCGPAALIFPTLDSRTAVTAAVLNIPLVTDINMAIEIDIFDLIRNGDIVRVDGNRGIIEVMEKVYDHGKI
ncbi:MAG: DUF126 domain-containing protein [Desulfamplus sp.]|nr:DUF126 domain-containing protein [Desulfamplus sp.]